MLTQPSPCPVLFAASNMNIALSIILLDYCKRSSIALPIVGLPLIHHSSTSVLGGSHEVRQQFFLILDTPSPYVSIFRTVGSPPLFADIMNGSLHSEESMIWVVYHNFLTTLLPNIFISPLRRLWR